MLITVGGVCGNGKQMCKPVFCSVCGKPIKVARGRGQNKKDGRWVPPSNVSVYVCGGCRAK